MAPRRNPIEKLTLTKSQEKKRSEIREEVNRMPIEDIVFTFEKFGAEPVEVNAVDFLKGRHSRKNVELMCTMFTCFRSNGELESFIASIEGLDRWHYHKYAAENMYDLFMEMLYYYLIDLAHMSGYKALEIILRELYILAQPLR